MKEKIFAFFETKYSQKKLNLLKTVYLNFRLLPFKHAIHFPIYVYGRWTFRYLGGEIAIISANPIKRGMIKLGVNLAGYVSTASGTLTIYTNARIIFRGRVNISQGVGIVVASGATLDMGGNVTLGDSVKIICYNSIIIGEKTDITWECQVMDFNSHFIENILTYVIKSITKPIVIGSYCWVCNRTTIMPGTIIPNRTIVTSNSLLNKSYAGIQPYTLLGGCPAKQISIGYKRIYNARNESFLKNHFRNNNVDFITSDSLLEKEVE